MREGWREGGRKEGETGPEKLRPQLKNVATDFVISRLKSAVIMSCYRTNDQFHQIS